MKLPVFVSSFFFRRDRHRRGKNRNTAKEAASPLYTIFSGAPDRTLSETLAIFHHPTIRVEVVIHSTNNRPLSPFQLGDKPW